VQDQLRAAGELDAVADAARRDRGDAGQDEQRAQGDEVLRLAQEVEVRIVQDLHGRS